MPTTITTVAATTVPLVTNDPDVIAKSVFDAVLNDKPISTTLQQSINYGFNFKTDLFYNYANNYYSYGLPVVTLFGDSEVSDDINDVVIDILEPLHGVTIKDISVEFTPPQLMDLFLHYIQESPDYDLLSSSKVSLTAARTTLEIATGIEYASAQVADMQLVGSNLVVDIPHRYRGNPTGDHPNLQLNIPLNLSSTTYMYHVRYTIDTIPGYTLWVYNPDLHTYPELTIEDSTYLDLRTFPIIPIRYDNENYVDYAEEEDVDSLEKLLRFINIDLQEFTENLTDPDNTSDIDDIDDMFLMFAADMDSDDDSVNQFLCEYFRQLKYTSRFSQQDYIDAINEGLDPNEPSDFFPATRIHYDQHNVRLYIKFHYIDVQVKGGNIGDPQPAYDPMTVSGTQADISIGADNDGIDPVTKNVYVDANNDTYGTNHYVTFRRQINDSEFLEITVHGLRSINTVRYGNDIVIRTLANMPDGGLFIPLSQSVVKDFIGSVETTIYYRTLNLTVYAVEETKLDWYENPNFLNAVGIFIIIVGVLMGAEDIAVMIAEGVTYSVIAAEIVIQIIMDVIYAEVFEEVANLIGAENAIILAILLAIAGQTIDANTFAEFGTLIDAETLMKAATALIEASNTITQDDFLNLEKEYSDFLEDAKEAQEKLEAAQDLLDTGIDIDLYTLISNNTYTNFYESPAGFYDRTIHNTNPGVASLDSIQSYFDRALRLPSLT